jgi:[ribosomal protein S5]-alanine N-acetyltransferase
MNAHSVLSIPYDGRSRGF